MKIYFDSNATTLLHPEVKDWMDGQEQKTFGNSSSIHWAGRQARSLLNEAREKLSSLLRIKESELIFTSGGTESINLALQGVFQSRPDGKRKIITSPLEHQAVLKTLEFLESKGGEVQYVSVDSKGRIDPQEISEKINSETLMVALMWANNEIGNLYPIQEIGQICREKNVLFFVDAVQAIGKIQIDLSRTPIDLLAFSGHKFHGPKGVGGLYVREGVPIQPILKGGSQEKSLRPGTLDSVTVSGLAHSLDKALNNIVQDTEFILKLSKKIQRTLSIKIEDILWNGETENRLFNTLNFRISGVSSETLLMNMDLEGIAASAGSACESGSIDPSHVLLGIGLSKKEAKESIRISLSKFNTEEEVDYFLEVFPKIITKIKRV